MKLREGYLADSMRLQSGRIVAVVVSATNQCWFHNSAPAECWEPEPRTDWATRWKVGDRVRVKAAKDCRDIAEDGVWPSADKPADDDANHAGRRGEVAASYASDGYVSVDSECCIWSWNLEADTEPAAPEPPAPKFAVNQVVEFIGGEEGLAITRQWYNKAVGAWQYDARRCRDGALVACLECDLRPHTMTTADLTQWQRKLVPGDGQKVRAKAILNGADGMPSHALGTRPAFQITSMDMPTAAGPGHRAFLHNLEPATEEVADADA